MDEGVGPVVYVRSSTPRQCPTDPPKIFDPWNRLERHRRRSSRSDFNLLDSGHELSECRYLGVGSRVVYGLTRDLPTKPVINQRLDFGELQLLLSSCVSTHPTVSRQPLGQHEPVGKVSHAYEKRLAVLTASASRALRPSICMGAPFAVTRLPRARALFMVDRGGHRPANLKFNPNFIRLHSHLHAPPRRACCVTGRT
ncbi:hypothetical protein EVAR_88624_1 [Eumeta japonica]|uniref:Uncharacterized protein n=1 Tax=Eumeta variegata TaxID=151549 RepID=A0A4C1X421_EUMVA|nr:hypothetical protein EVAR_88624_1 [Eumeta japonica]